MDSPVIQLAECCTYNAIIAVRTCAGEIFIWVWKKKIYKKETFLQPLSINILCLIATTKFLLLDEGFEPSLRISQQLLRLSHLTNSGNLVVITHFV